MNRVILMGRLTRDPDVRYTNNQKVVCQFTVAVDRPFTNQQGQREADFIPVVVWGRTAELCGNSLAKGHRILVEGRMQVRSYDAKDGSRRWITEVIGDRIEFIERKEESANRGLPGSDSFGGRSQGGYNNGGGYGGQGGSGMEALGSDVPFDEEVPF